MRDLIRAADLPVRLVDLSTTGAHTGADILAHQIAAFHPRGAAGVFTGDRGRPVAAMAEAFARWIGRQQGIAGIASAGGSGGPRWRRGNAGVAGWGCRSCWSRPSPAARSGSMSAPPTS